MSRLNPRHVRDTATVTTSGGRNASGPVAGTDVDVRVVFSSRSRLVLDKDGTEVVSEATLLASPETNPGKDLESLFAPGLAVTVRSREYSVVRAEPAVSRGRLIYVSIALA